MPSESLLRRAISLCNDLPTVYALLEMGSHHFNVVFYVVYVICFNHSSLVSDLRDTGGDSSSANLQLRRRPASVTFSRRRAAPDISGRA